MKHRLTIVAVVIITLAAAASARAEIKLAYVDIQRALNECNAGKQAKIKMQGRLREIESKLRSQQTEVQSLQQELEKKGMLMRTDQRQNLQDEYTTKLRDFQQSYKNVQEELRRKDNEITASIVRDLAVVVRNIGEKDGYTMVMEKGEILWGIPSIDITDQVVRAYDAMHVTTGALGEEAARAASGQPPQNRLNLGSAPSTQTDQFGSTVNSKRSTISR